VDFKFSMAVYDFGVQQNLKLVGRYSTGMQAALVYAASCFLLSMATAAATQAPCKCRFLRSRNEDDIGGKSILENFNAFAILWKGCSFPFADTGKLLSP
jgi:hypothetical protein